MKRNGLLIIAALAVIFALGSCSGEIEAAAPAQISEIDEIRARGPVADIRMRDPKTGRSYAQMLIDTTPVYGSVVGEIAFAPELPPDYVLDADSIRGREREYGHVFLSARYTCAGTNAGISLSFAVFDTQAGAQDSWKVSLAGYAIQNLPPVDPDIMVGDAAVGTPSNLNFVRGNIHVRIRELGGNPIAQAAREVDAQIIRALEDG